MANTIAYQDPSYVVYRKPDNVLEAFLAEGLNRTEIAAFVESVKFGIPLRTGLTRWVRVDAPSQLDAIQKAIDIYNLPDLLDPMVELHFPRDLYAQLEAQAESEGIGVDSLIFRYCYEGASRTKRKACEKKTKIKVPSHISIE